MTDAPFEIVQEMPRHYPVWARLLILAAGALGSWLFVAVLFAAAFEFLGL